MRQKLFNALYITREILRPVAQATSATIVFGFGYLIIGNTFSSASPTQSKIDFCTDQNQALRDTLSSSVGFIDKENLDRTNGVAKILLEVSYDGTPKEFDDHGLAGSYNCGRMYGTVEYDLQEFSFQDSCLRNTEKLDAVLASFNLYALINDNLSGEGKVYFQAFSTDTTANNMCGNTFETVELNAQPS